MSLAIAATASSGYQQANPFEPNPPAAFERLWQPGQNATPGRNGVPARSRTFSPLKWRTSGSIQGKSRIFSEIFETRESRAANVSLWPWNQAADLASTNPGAIRKENRAGSRAGAAVRHMPFPVLRRGGCRIPGACRVSSFTPWRKRGEAPAALRLAKAPIFSGNLRGVFATG